MNTALTLKDLPPPPVDKTGWPWTEQTNPLPDKMPDGSDWPSISVITPNYNYGQFIEETIRSVLLQGYPNLEYIVIDGGSTDNSLDIIKRYEPWLTYWVSEKDRGQSNAINKGLEKCTGEFFNWINSDDFLEIGGLANIAKKFKKFDLLAGQVKNFGENNNIEEIYVHNNLSATNLILNKCNYHQPGIWLRTEMLRKLDAFTEDLNYTFDWELTIKYLACFSKVTYTNNILVNFRLHSNAKTNIEYNEILKERKIALSNISYDEKYKRLHKYIQKYMKTQLWHSELRQILSLKGLNKYQKLLQVIQHSFTEPNIRISRFTLGAIRNLLISEL